MNIGSVGAAGSIIANPSNNRVTTDEFTKLLVTQLQWQDPTEPMKNEELMAQFIGIRTMETQELLTNSISALGKHQELATASGLIGKWVLGIADDGVQVLGAVTSVTASGDQVKLIVNGREMALGGIQTVLAPLPTGGEGQGEGGGDA